MSSDSRSSLEDSCPEKGLLTHELKLEEAEGRLTRLRSWVTTTWTGGLLLHLAIAAIYTAVLTWTFYYNRDNRFGNCVPSTQVVYSPAKEAVSYERVRFNATLVIDSPYNGGPGPEVDKAWHDVLENMNIAVPASDLKRIGASSIEIPDQPGYYLAGLSVFHELHCLKRIYQFTWADHYHKGLTADEVRLNRLHTDHCIDILCQATMCRADTSLFTLEWSEGQVMPRADFSHEHTCANWQAVFEWAGERRVSKQAMLRLKHPSKGAAFPDGHTATLGASEDKSHAIVVPPSDSI